MAPSKNPKMGQIIEYIPDRLYLASYLTAPNEDTLFPGSESTARSPSKRARQAAEAAAASPSRIKPYYFTIDDSLLYNAFHHDFGPLHIGHLYRFALQFHEILAAKENEGRPVVFWSRADPRSRANASCVLACYMVLIQSWPPHLALAPIAQVDPPLMPFRDAGYSQADYGITVQDVVYGVWKAKEEGCIMLESFDLDEYEKYERVEHGDFNWVTPNFLAFASPQHSPVGRISEDSDLWNMVPKTLEAVAAHPTLSPSFKNVLTHFTERNIGLVVRLNSHLYSPSFFEALGMQHLDMIFDDGTCPPLSTVRKFIQLAHETITVKKKSIAVHCKAGLGRTGCLIGAYLIYRHGFTANEVMAYMRFMRPGMVVGPQQHWLHINQGVFRQWWVEERTERKLRKEAALAAANQPSTPIRAMQKASLGRSSSKHHASTPSNNRVSSRTPLGELDQGHARDNDILPAPTPGQPRKGQPSPARHHPYSRSTSLHHSSVEEERGVFEQVETEVVSVHRTSQCGDEEDELHVRTRTHRKPSAPLSPERRDATADMDVENLGSIGRAKTIDQRCSSASGVLARVRTGAGSSSSGGRRAATTVRDGGVRKTSGRIGSVAASAASAAAISVARKISGP